MNTKQVPDDPELLKLMLEDTRRADDLYRPTNYWARYEKIFAPELFRMGLKDFRRREKSVLRSFGAIDISPVTAKINLFKNKKLNNAFLCKIPAWTRFLSGMNMLLNRTLPLVSSYDIQDLKKISYDFVKSKASGTNAKPIERLSASLDGNPEDVLEMNGNFYTTSILNYYLRYAYCSRFIDFDDIGLVVELGCGAGKQAEVIKKLHPDTCLALFDIPPQIYVCEQYLRSVFPDSVVSYRDTRDLAEFPRGDHRGKIFIFGNWKFPILDTFPVIDLFWNAASFQEMEPEVVANYLGFVNERASRVFLQENMSGKEMAKKEGLHGVLRQTTLEDYKKGLSAFDITDISLSQVPFPLKVDTAVKDSLWKKRSTLSEA